MKLVYDVNMQPVLPTSLLMKFPNFGNRHIGVTKMVGVQTIGA